LDFLCSTFSDVDPGSVLGSRTTEPVAAEQNVTGQTAPEQPVAQPAAAPVTQVADEGPAQDRAEASARQGMMGPQLRRAELCLQLSMPSNGS